MMDEERLRIMAALDVEAAAEWMPGASKEVRLAALHKARYECPDVAAELRHASGEWLRSMGYCRTYGRPLLPIGDLPA